MPNYIYGQGQGRYGICEVSFALLHHHDNDHQVHGYGGYHGGPHHGGHLGHHSGLFFNIIHNMMVLELMMSSSSPPPSWSVGPGLNLKIFVKYTQFLQNRNKRFL